MAIRWLQQPRAPEAILSALIQEGGLSRRQAYRYLQQAQAQGQGQLQPVPGPKAVFTVNLPVKLIQAVRARCRQQERPISQIVAQVLEHWLEAGSAHG